MAFSSVLKALWCTSWLYWPTFHILSASSSNIVASWDKKFFGQLALSIVKGFVLTDNIVLRATQVNYFVLHRPTIDNEDHTGLLMCLSWYKFHHKMLSLGKPLTVWSLDIFEPEGVHSIIPIQMFNSSVVSLQTKVEEETVLIVSPCVEWFLFKYNNICITGGSVDWSERPLAHA